MTEVRVFSQDKGETAWLRKHGLPDKESILSADFDQPANAIGN